VRPVSQRQCRNVRCDFCCAACCWFAPVRAPKPFVVQTFRYYESIVLFVGRPFLSCVHLRVNCLSASLIHVAERVLLAAACCDSSQNFDRQSFGAEVYSAWLPVLSVMVRFHWHVEQGMSAYMPPDGITLQKDSKVQQASCEIEVSSHSCRHSSCSDADFFLATFFRRFLAKRKHYQLFSHCPQAI